MAEAFLVMSVRSLSSPLHNADKLYGSAAADHSVVTVPPSVADILAKIKDGSASLGMIEKVHAEVDQLAADRLSRHADLLRRHEETTMQSTLHYAVQQAVQQAMEKAEKERLLIQGSTGIGKSSMLSNIAGEAQPLPQEIGCLADTLAFEFNGVAHTKQEELLSKESKVATSDLVEAIRALLHADTNADKATCLALIFDTASIGIGGTTAAHGAVPLDQAIRSGAVPLQLAPKHRVAAGSPGTFSSTNVPLSKLMACRTEAEALEICSDHMQDIKAGQVSGMAGGYDASTDTRVIPMSHDLRFTLMQRHHVQALIADGFQKVFSDDVFVEGLPYSSEFKALRLSLLGAIKKPYFGSEIFGDAPSHASSLLSSFLPNLNIASNCIATALYILRDRFRVQDLRALGFVLQEFYLGSNEAPMDAFGRIHNAAAALPEPNPAINFSILGADITPGSNGDGSTFTIVSDNSIAAVIGFGLGARLEQGGPFADARKVFTDEIIDRARAGLMTKDELFSLIADCNRLNITLNVPGSAGASAPNAAFGAFVKGKDKGKSKGNSYAGVTAGGGGSGGGSSDRGGGSGGASGGGGGGGNPRGRAINRGEQPKRSPSIGHPGDVNGEHCYARFVTLLGGKGFPNFIPCADLINVYFKKSKSFEAFAVNAQGSVKIPLQLNPHFTWHAHKEQFLNYNVRRDVFAAWCVLRDLFLKGTPDSRFGSLSRLGREYAKSDNSWKALSAADFDRIHKPANSKAKLDLQKIQIKGLLVNEFTN